MKKIILAGMIALIVPCGIGATGALRNSHASQIAIKSNGCECTHCSCTDCKCTGCSGGNCSDGCCENGQSGVADCCKK
jgi:hypothetical protein